MVQIKPHTPLKKKKKKKMPIVAQITTLTVPISSQVPLIVEHGISEALECDPGWSNRIEGSVGSLRKQCSKLKRMLVAKP